MHRPFVLSALFVASVSIPLAITACTASTEDSSPANPTSEDDLKLGGVGADCSTKNCKSGLVCKASAGSMPTGSSGKPVMGMPIQKHTCQKPEPGEAGSTCTADADCDPGLTCEFSSKSSSSSGGPPPGALGMPVPSSTSTSNAPVMGMPVKPTGTCEPKATSSSSGGPPPGTLGMPIHP
jgi:hypothetical protein